jgi:hypothetical protein
MISASIKFSSEGEMVEEGESVWEMENLFKRCRGGEHRVKSAAL